VKKWENNRRRMCIKNSTHKNKIFSDNHGNNGESQVSVKEKVKKTTKNNLRRWGSTPGPQRGSR
jgi:hypothetical protein